MQTFMTWQFLFRIRPTQPHPCLTRLSTCLVDRQNLPQRLGAGYVIKQIQLTYPMKTCKVIPLTLNKHVDHIQPFIGALSHGLGLQGALIPMPIFSFSCLTQSRSRLISHCPCLIICVQFVASRSFQHIVNALIHPIHVNVKLYTDNYQGVCTSSMC